MSLESLYEAVHEACLPGIWSKGVALSRGEGVVRDSVKDGELILRVKIAERAVHPKVTLWINDDDWYCDCGDRADPCPHVAAGVIALKAGKISLEAQAAQTAPTSTPQLVYRFTRAQGELHLSRAFVRATASGPEERPLEESLASFVGGVRSGRIAYPLPITTQDDFAVDHALGTRPECRLERQAIARVLRALETQSGLTLDGAPVTVSGKAVRLKALALDEGRGIRIRRVVEENVELFSNGAALAAGVLRPLEEIALGSEERETLSTEGKLFRPEEAARLVAEVIPTLEKKVDLELRTTRLPRLEEAEPRIVIRTENGPGESLSVVPLLLYGDPPIARVVSERELEPLVPGRVPVRKLAEEKQLARKLQAELHLYPGQLARFSGREAVEFRQKLEGWQLEGTGARAFAVAGALSARIEVGASGSFEVRFEGPGGASADPARVFQAWRENSEYVPLWQGGWAKLPEGWLNRYGERIQELLAMQAARRENALPGAALPELLEICEESGSRYPESLARLKKTLETYEGLPQPKLPTDLRATLRHYQITGVSWLSFLRDHGMGALLADDMGLGKTMQAVSAIEGPALVVCPTSVLETWMSHLRDFRPALKASLFYGPGRKLDESADVVVTTYGLLRSDRELLTARSWKTAILDEAHVIKNPESQISQAAYRIHADFRVALTGTPIENRLDDLWSQFQFLNPGLLGARDEFIARYGSNPAQLRKRVRPFILRRLKREVAPELPPRTEVALHCELSAPERELYQSVYAVTRSEVLKLLEEGRSTFSALEALLRLRQSCCHPALVPGSAQATAPSSSKLELLLESLRESIDAGHRALVFSQWTSLLDLIEPLLRDAGISFSRLDGSTRDRDAVVAQFQAPLGPSVMLISLKAGGVGITLTAADHVYILDPWWNPAIEDQAADRAHRIGQINPVLVQRLIARDTVEDRILELQRRKRELAQAVVSGEMSEAAAVLSREDLMELLRD